MVVFLSSSSLPHCEPVDEREADPQLQDELLQLAEDGGLQVLLAVGVGQPEEVEEVRVAEDQVGRQLVLLAQCLQFLPRQLRRLPRQRRPLEQHVLYLGPQCPHGPALDATHLGVEVALHVVGEGDDLDEMTPAQVARQLAGQGRPPQSGSFA
jgi:hypothetical protein